MLHFQKEARRRLGVIGVLGALALTALIPSTAVADEASVRRGAELYHERCVICHGAEGFGDGLLPMYMSDYPNTALLRARSATTRDEILDAISLGGTRNGVDQSPPWKEELSADNISALADLVVLMREDRDGAFALLDETRPATVPTQREGRVLFLNYCSRCHGEGGYGDGRMAKVYKNPPPFPLVYSAMPGAYLTHIITGGGDSVGRSEVMPSFAEQLKPSQIQSVILHLYSIRLLNTKKFH